MTAPVGLGIVGLGMAGTMMVRAAAAHPGIRLCAGADPNPLPRQAFARDFNAAPYEDIAALCRDPAVEAVYIATPHQYHAPHAILAAEHGKHIALEKPMALTLADCDAIVAAVERAGVTLIIGHTHGFDPAIQAMRRIIAAGELGPLGMIATWNYTNFLYRPRRPEELDTAAGGGILFNQVPHQIDICRLLGGGLVRSVRAAAGCLDPARGTEGHCNAFLDFADGASATMVYGGYDFFDSDELHFGISEGGAVKRRLSHGAARRALVARTAPETALRGERAYGAAGAALDTTAHQTHFGITIVTGAKGELRASADGIILYDEAGAREIAVPRGPTQPSHGDVLDALVAALRQGQKPLQDARWGRASVEVMLAIQRSAAERREIALEHQVAVPAGR